MRFINCIAHRRGLFDNRVLDFRDRLNIVYGKNGAGKSLLARGMIDAVWGRLSDRPLLDEDAWGSLYLDVGFALSGTGSYRAFNGGVGGLRIEYARNGEVKPVYEARHNEGTGDAPAAEFSGDDEGRAFHDFIRAVDCDAFVNTSFIPSAADMPRDSLVDFGAVKKILMDDRTGFFNSYLNLRDTFPADAVRDGGMPGEVVRFQEKMRDLEKKMQIMDISDSRHEKLRREKETIQGEMDDLNNSLNSLKSQKEILFKIIENLNKVEELKNEFDSIKDEIQNEQRKIDSMTEMKTELDAMFPQFSGIDIEDGTNLDRLQDVFNDIRNLNQRIDDYHHARSAKIKKAVRIAWAAGAGGLAGALFILGYNGFQFMKDLYLWTGTIALALAVNGAVGVRLFALRRDRTLLRLDEEKRRFKVRITALMEKSRLELEDYKLTEIYELLLQYFEDYVNYTERKKDLALIKSSLKEEEYMIRIQNKLDALKREEAMIKDEIHTSIDTLNIVDDIENETSRIEDLIRNIDTEMAILKEKVETKDRILDQIDGEIQRASGNGGAVSGIMEEMDGIERILRKWKVNRNSMAFIAGALNEAVRRNEEKRIRKLLDGTLDKFNHLTGNQYITRIDGDTALNMIRDNCAPEEFTPPVMHAFMLSLKFSLSDFITGGNAEAPLLIDEPFQFMDDERCARFRDLVSYESNRRQVIIFTHQSDKRNWGNFIEL